MKNQLIGDYQMNTIETLTKEWKEMTEKLLKCELINLDTFKDLSRKTHNLMYEYSNKDSVPKEICHLLLELQWFSWWVADAEFTPMHGLYQELGNVINALICLFSGPDEKYNDIEPFLDSF